MSIKQITEKVSPINEKRQYDPDEGLGKVSKKRVNAKFAPQSKSADKFGDQLSYSTNRKFKPICDVCHRQITGVVYRIGVDSVCCEYCKDKVVSGVKSHFVKSVRRAFGGGR